MIINVITFDSGGLLNLTRFYMSWMIQPSLSKKFAGNQYCFKKSRNIWYFNNERIDNHLKKIVFDSGSLFT